MPHIAGVKLDCNLSTNFTGAGCTNNDAAINGLLATATAANPVTVIVDGGTVTSGLLIPTAGNVTIQCPGWDAGFVLASGSNAHMLNNVSAGNPYNWGGTPGTPGQNVIIRDCRWNGNQPNAGTGAGSFIAPNGGWLFGLSLDNLAHVLIEHNWFYNIATYNVHLEACTDCIVENNRFDAFVHGLHQDGLHVDGPSSQIRAAHNWFNNSDDAIAMNTTEGYGGPIAGVIVDSNHCVACLTAYKQLSNESGGSTTNAAVSGVVVTNGSGTIKSYAGNSGCAFRLGDLSASGTRTPDIMQDVAISNSTYATLDNNSEMIEVDDNVGTLTVSNVHLVNPEGTPPFLQFGGTATISNFVCRACGVHRSAIGAGNVPFTIVPSGNTITRLDLDWVLTDQQGQTFPPLSWLIDVQSGGSIGTLFLESIDPTHSPTLLNGNEWSRIANFYGPGVSTYYRNTTYANLPPASYAGLSVSLSDSSAGGVLGATEAGGSPGHYAQLNSNGAHWTVTGK